MVHWTKRIVIVLGTLGAVYAVGGCCNSNESKTKSCKHTTTSEACKKCCGGNYSFVGSKPNSCTCY